MKMSKFKNCAPKKEGKAKILIDAKPLITQLTGIGRYTYEIVKRLDKDKFDPFYDYGFISKELNLANDDLQEASSKAFKQRLLRPAKRFLSFLPQKIKTNLRFLLRKLNEHNISKQNFDLYFQPNFIPLNIKVKHIVVSVHDFTFIKFKEFHPKDRIEFFERFFMRNIKKATHIITGSNFTKSEIVEILGFDEGKISVIYHGYDDKVFYPKDDTQKVAVKAKLNLTKEFILFAGSIEPRKNLATLIKAYNLLPSDLQAKFDLVIVGAKGWENSQIHELINQNENIKFAGFVADEELAALYSSASVFVYPSIYEGFGIPPLEAMACGCAVALSDIEVFREIYGEDAVYFDSLNEADLKEKLEILLTDEKMREDFARIGLRRCKDFSWAKSAKAHNELFLRLLS